MTEARIGSSFRDPSGFIFTRDGVLLRQVQEIYRPQFELLHSSGLYDELVAEGLLIPHEERPLDEASSDGAAFVLRPERIPFVSMPYEWTFGQYKAAALLTLRVQEISLKYGMTLKDASAFNVQFRGVTPIFLDTLSFEKQLDGAPWVAYRQFCQHFLAPLALQSKVDARLGLLLRQYVDGIPLDLASHLLSRRSWLSPAMLMHIHLHARSIAKHAATDASTDLAAKRVHTTRVSKTGLDGLISHLHSTVAGLEWKPRGTEWGAYEETHNYDADGRDAKQLLVAEFVKKSGAKRMLDLGANAGEYARVARGAGADLVVAADGDPVAVERAFRRFTVSGETGIHPILMDLTNPSPSQGWNHTEWPSIAARGPFDAVMGLALVHHLAIGNNVPLHGVGAMFAKLGRAAIVEWVPKADPQVQRLLSAREDIFDNYTEGHFRDAFSQVGREVAHSPVGNSGRTLYLFAS